MRAILDTSVVIAHGVGRLDGELPLDEAVAASYGRVAAAVVAAGRQPRARTMGPLIAATAHAHSARVYTRNPKDFVGVEPLVEVIAI